MFVWLQNCAQIVPKLCSNCAQIVVNLSTELHRNSKSLISSKIQVGVLSRDPGQPRPPADASRRLSGSGSGSRLWRPARVLGSGSRPRPEPVPPARARASGSGLSLASGFRPQDAGLGPEISTRDLRPRACSPDTQAPRPVLSREPGPLEADDSKGYEPELALACGPSKAEEPIHLISLKPMP
jgi:hypothetical protein